MLRKSLSILNLATAIGATGFMTLSLTNHWPMLLVVAFGAAGVVTLANHLYFSQDGV